MFTKFISFKILFCFSFIGFLQSFQFPLLSREETFFRRHFNSTNQVPYNFLDNSGPLLNACSSVTNHEIAATTVGYIPIDNRPPLHFVTTYPHYLDCCCLEPEDCVPSTPRSLADPRFEPSYPRVYSRGLCSWRNGKPRDTVSSRNSIVRSRC
uniref:Uncharacterized protein n=1 Tax=Aphis glycines nege-like virus 1 iso 1 TaxID=2961855 RepID=A0A976RXE0_9VIRU|nr:hypothetical protein 3 [Aphis glycines nege-like virus 1 iso 1]